MMRLLGGLLLAASASANAVGHASQVAGKMQELNLQQLEALYALLDDDGSGTLTVHEMIDLFDGINNDALLIDDCNGNPAPHHWLGDGYCDDGTDADDGGLDFNCNIFLCDDSDCGDGCRVVEGRDQVEVGADMGIVYGNIRDANGEDFEIDLEAGTTYYIWTNIADGTTHHVQDTTMTLFDADGTTVLAQNDDGPAGAVNSYIEYTPTATIASATILVAPKTRQDRGTFQLQVSVTQPDLTVRPPPPPQIGGPSYDFCFGSNNDNTARQDFETGSAALPAGWTMVDDVPVSEAGNWYVIDNTGADLANDGWAAYEASNVWGNYPGDNQLTGSYLMNDVVYDQFIAEFEVFSDDNDGLGFLFGYQSLESHFTATEINDIWPSPPADGYSGPHQKLRQRDGACLPSMNADNTVFSLLESEDGDDGVSVNKANYSPYRGSVIMNMALKVECCDGDGKTIVTFLSSRHSSTGTMESVEKLTGKTDSYTAGTLGLFVYAHTAKFDNFQVTPLDGTAVSYCEGAGSCDAPTGVCSCSIDGTVETMPDCSRGITAGGDIVRVVGPAPPPPQIGGAETSTVCMAAGLGGDAGIVGVDDLLALLAAYGQECTLPTSAMVSIFISHVQYANTGGDLYATIHGSTGTSPEVLITNGADSRLDYTVEVPTTGIGSFVSLDVRLTSNDGVHISEYEVVYPDGNTYNWPIQQWHDGDSAENPPVRTLTLDAASTLLDITSAASTITITAVTGDVANAETSNAQMIQIWGTNGYLAPMELTGFGASRAATNTIELAIPDIGEFVAAKITNTGNNGWHLYTLTIETSATSSDWAGTWVYNKFLDGDGGTDSPHADIFMAIDAATPPAAGEVETVVILQTSARDNAQTNGAITVTVNGASGSSDPRICASGGIDARSEVVCSMNHAALGELRSITVALTGNNGVHFNEIRAIYAGTAEVTWLFDTDTTHDGWLDGDSSSADILPSQDLLVADASPALTEVGTVATVTTATGNIDNANTNAAILITVYGSNGHFGPVSLTGGVAMTRGAVEVWSLDMPDIGDLFAVKLLNSGNDGWFLEELRLDYNGVETNWAYNQWIDGDGSTSTAPHSDFFYASEGLITGSGEIATIVTLSTSFEANADTSDPVYVQLHGTDGSSDEVLASSGIVGRSDLDVQVIHGDIGHFTGVTVRLDGNNGVHFNEVRVAFAVATEFHAHYTWLLTTITGWLDGPIDCNPCWPASRTFTTDTASPAVLSDIDGAADFMPVLNSNNAHISVWGTDVASAVDSLPVQEMTVSMWTKWVAGGSDWAGPISASQDDGSNEYGWNIQTRCVGSCAVSRRIEFSLSTAGSNAAEGTNNGHMAYLGYPGDARRCTYAESSMGEIYAPIDGAWQHLAYSYDGASTKAYVDGVLVQQDDVTSAGPILYPAPTYSAGQGGWFTIGAYHDANEYYSFPGAIDELKIWHTARVPELGCNVPATDPMLNYYWKFDNMSPAALDSGSIILASAGPNGVSAGGLGIVSGKCSSTVQVTTVTGTRNNAQSGSMFLITFYGTEGHSVPQVLSNSFENGAVDTHTFEVGDVGELLAIKITNTGNDGWRLMELTVEPAMNSDFAPMTWSYDKWIDGDGSSEAAPHADFFFWDGTTASDSASSFGLTDMQLACPAEAGPCFADATGVCPGEIAAVLGGTMAPTAATSPLSGALVTCLLTAMAGR